MRPGVSGDVAPGNRSRVNESPQPAGLGRGLDHETHQTHSPEQIIRKLKTAEQLIAQGKTVADVCPVIEVAQPTSHRWRQQNGGMQAEEARRLTELEKENARLNKLLAEAELEKAMLKDLVADVRRTLRCDGSGGRRACSAPLPGSASGHGLRTAQCSATGPNPYQV